MEHADDAPERTWSQVRSDRQAESRRRQRPDNELPASVAFEAVLGENENLAVFLCGLSVYRRGVDLTVEVRASPRYEESFTDDADFLGAAVVSGGMLLGVEFADGRRCTNLPPEDLHLRADEPVLWSDGGSGGPRSAAVSWFLSPLPPPGDLRIMFAWPGRSLPESATSLPAEPILAAAARARELWPWQPRREDRRREPSFQVPEGGWFAEHIPTT